uniref:PEPxxWA-CTERM sorting domain-containing protein n=1 Tax=Polymorphobacter sp. TaxID=1909290 RepID=UPI003F6FCAAD
NTGGTDGAISLVTDTGFTLTSGDNNAGGYTFLRGIADAAVTLSGSWTYLTLDSGGPEFDPAGYVVNDMLVTLTNDADNIQSGVFSFDVDSGDRFGFFVRTLDGGFGPASLTISGLSPAYTLGGNEVPEPASWAMLIAGFGLVGATLRRRRSVARLA